MHTKTWLMIVTSNTMRNACYLVNCSVRVFWNVNYYDISDMDFHYITYIHPYSPTHDYCRFLPILLVDQITDIGNKMCV